MHVLIHVALLLLGKVGRRVGFHGGWLFGLLVAGATEVTRLRLARGDDVCRSAVAADYEAVDCFGGAYFDRRSSLVWTHRAV